MANIKELQSEEVSQQGTSSDTSVTIDGTGSTIADLNVGEKAKEVAGDVTEGLFDALLTKGFRVPDSAKAGAAFGAALVDGWSFGAFGLLMGAMGLGDEMDNLRKEHPTLSTAGDIASFITPGVAVKIWLGATKLGAKQMAKVMASRRTAATEEIKKRTLAKMDEFLQAGSRPAGDISGFVSDVLKIS